jgi:hypothetical protein
MKGGFAYPMSDDLIWTDYVLRVSVMLSKVQAHVRMVSSMTRFLKESVQ